jgi:probable F420-dependent oxidoreductase
MADPKIHFGIGLPVVQQVQGKVRAWERSAGPAEIEVVASAADRLGYAHIACSDHVIVPRTRLEAMGGPWYESIATLAYLGGRTTQIELLTHVLVLPYHNPLALAKSLATLDVMTRGRLIAGVGSGHLKPEFKVLRIPFEERAAMTDEYIEVLKTLWESEAPEWSGKYFPFRDVVLEPRPHRKPRPPIWVGGNSRRIVRRSVEHADGWVPWQISLDELRELVAYGRELGEKTSPRGRWDVAAPFPTMDLVGAGRRPAGEGAVLSDTDEIAARIDRFRSVGVTRLHVSFLHDCCGELVEQLEAFAERVMKRL